MKKSLSILMAISVLSGCATIFNGENQRVTVLTPPANDAQCALENDKGKWLISQTPSSVLIRRSDKNLLITCEKNAFNKKSISIKPELSKVVYANMIFGGAVGGYIGGYIDKKNGAAYAYPSEITVPFKAEKNT